MFYFSGCKICSVIAYQYLMNLKGKLFNFSVTEIII